jgi:hypothetical protein
MKERTLKNLRVAAWLLLAAVFLFPSVDYARLGSPVQNRGFEYIGSLGGQGTGRVIRYPQWLIQFAVVILLIVLLRRRKGTDYCRKSTRILAGPETLTVLFSDGAKAEIALSELVSLHLQTIPSMSMDIDIVSLNRERGDSFEINDSEEGFREACELLSAKFSILPEISKRFPVADGEIAKVYERSPSHR